MGGVIGFALGYVLGTRAGDDGYEELRESWRVISATQEVRDLLTGGLAVARDLVPQGRGMLAERLQNEPGHLRCAA